MPGSLPLPRACVFDLDGTLVDSLRDIADALNRCLDILGLPSYPVEHYRYMVGEGVPVLCQRAVGATHPHLVHRLAELARPEYRCHLLDHTHPYSGVPELIERLRGAGIQLGVLSNKPHDLTVRVIDAYWPDGTFDAVYGYIDDEHRKPSPYYLERICGELSVATADTWLIGDTPTDVATARAAGAVPIGVAWGFRACADLESAGAVRIVDHPDELP